ncbi:non-canonical purine NTP pyrophosphatase [Paenibacillus sp. IB182496]|uniref:dITP/XTP pyrophosphatase n=1 Tax=Paenibacillus sabuli TaxID=2772509 RepID=A0A927BSK3_9BACL|nr:non-canonical purine NTP pyrophosphatase [Paenibacillus sabuli]MBD2844658.1 non-canonical purine NTP pyrophosphatase [Paenibacillus sabuli]
MSRPADVIVIATGNRGKVAEFAHAFGELGIGVRSLIDYPGLEPAEETGDTFAANALLKAQAVARALGVPALADDSGLCVDALGGAPGVYSARYAGEGAGDSANNAKLLATLAEGTQSHEEAAAYAAAGGYALPDGVRALSRARFVCALALYDPASGKVTAVEGAAPGVILDRPLGDGGFGYDPLFWVPQLGCTMAQLTKPQKQAISHRGAALGRLLPLLRD